MEDNYFDDKLKGILESHPEFEPDQSAMLDMQGRLRAIEKPNRQRGGLFFLIPLLLLPVLLGLGFFYYKYNSLNDQVAALNQKVSEMHQNLQHDTIIEKQVIHHYDTIHTHTVVYREKYIREKQTETNKNNVYQYGFQSPLYAPNHVNPSPFYTPNILDWSIGSSKNSLFAKNPGSSIFSNYLRKIETDNESESIVNKFMAAEPIASLGPLFLPIDDRKNPDWVAGLSDKFPEYKEPEINPAYYFIPNGFTVGINTSPYVFPFNSFGSQGRSFGLSGAIEFPGGRSLEVGGTFMSTSFEVKDDPVQFALFPVIAPNDPADVLHEVKGKFSYLEIPIILRQRFREDRDLMPFISAGFVAYKPLRQAFAFEYLNGTGEYNLNTSFKNGVFSVDNLRLGLGAEYSLGKHISAAAELQYQHGLSLNANEYFKLRYFVLNVGLRYKM